MKYPDIAASVPGLIKPGVKSVVLDCEAVAFERETGKILPFQVACQLLSQLLYLPAPTLYLYLLLSEADYLALPGHSG